MTRHLWFWAAWFVVGAAYEVWAVWFRPATEDTLSEFVAHLFKSGTVAGWWALMFVMGTLACWFPAHTRRLALERKARDVAADRTP